MTNETKKINERQRKTLEEISQQVEMALQSENTPEAVKECLKTIIIEAATESDLPLSDFSLVRAALPNIIENLPQDYGRGVLHSIHAIILHNTDAFQRFYDQRLDEAGSEKECNLELADELAEFIGKGIYPMDVWQFVVDTLETMAKRNGLGFNDYDYVKTVAPLLLERNENNREAVVCMLEAVKRKRGC
jgi:hypothetical protein